LWHRAVHHGSRHLTSASPPNPDATLGGSGSGAQKYHRRFPNTYEASGSAGKHIGRQSQDPSTRRPRVRFFNVFSRDGFLRGARRAFPLALSGAPFGLVLGVLAGRAGLTVWELLAMSALVFAG